MLWPILLVVSILFWPSIFVHSEPAKTIASAAWYGSIGFIVILLVSIDLGEKIYLRRIARRVRREQALLDRWDPPDLRKSDMFEGTWN